MCANTMSTSAGPTKTVRRRIGVAIAAAVALVATTLPGGVAAATEAPSTAPTPTQAWVAPAVPAAAIPLALPAMYTVVPGDSLSLIAVTHGMDLLTGWARIYNANLSIAHPDLIWPGMPLRIPAPDEQLVPRALAPPPPQASGGEDGTASDSGTTSASSSAPVSSGGGVWDRLAQCESSGNWSSTVGTYDGGLQFHPQTWNAYGGGQYAPSADRASREEQIAVAERVLAGQGWGAWPACSSKLGLR